MGFKLKNGYTYTDASDNVYNNAYAVIDKFVEYDKRKRVAIVFIEIYKSKNALENGKRPLSGSGSQYVVSGELFDTYFSVAAINADDNPFKQAYLYVSTLAEWASWETDEAVN